MKSYDYDIGIIGGGAAGLTVTSGSAQLGARTLLIEKEANLGGDCLHFGCVPSKTLIHSAALYHRMQEGEKYGLPEIKPPPIDFRQIRSHIQNVISSVQKHDSVERFNALGAEVRFGSPRFQDEHSVILNHKTISARSWVIATGSSPAPPRNKILEGVDYITNRDIFFLDRLPDSMLVLGAGPIAIEMAQAFCRLGTKVYVVQRSGQILSKEDRDMADTIMAVLEDEGVQFFLNADISSIETSNGCKEITVKQGDMESRVMADTVLLAQGRIPNTRGLGLRELDIAMSPGGITVDRRMRCSRKNIYAPGDVNGGFQFTHAAGYEGGIVIANAIFHLPKKTDTRWMPWCTYSDPELASVGMNEKRATDAGIEYRIIEEQFSDNDRARTEGRTRGRLKILLDRKERPIGVQILGPRAGELLGEWTAVLNGGLKLSTLASTIHAYPTLAEINKKAAGRHLSEKLFSDNTRKILKILFRLRGSNIK